MPTIAPRGALDADQPIAWLDDLRAASGGRLDVTGYGSEEIMPLLETFEGTSRGVIEMNYTFGSYWTGKVPEAEFGMPPDCTLRELEEYLTFYQRYGIEDILRQAYAKQNIFYLRFIPAGSAALQTTFPVNRLTDLEGRKLRMTGHTADVLSASGASGVFFPSSEIYGALEKGTIEGFVFANAGLNYSMGWHEVSKYIMLPRLMSPGVLEVHVNMDAWNSLPDDLKDLLYQSAAHFGYTAHSGHIYEDNLRWEEMVRDWGFEHTFLPEEDFQVLRNTSMKLMEEKAAKYGGGYAQAVENLKHFMTQLGIY